MLTDLGDRQKTHGTVPEIVTKDTALRSNLQHNTSAASRPIVSITTLNDELFD